MEMKTFEVALNHKLKYNINDLITILDIPDVLVVLNIQKLFNRKVKPYFIRICVNSLHWEGIICINSAKTPTLINYEPEGRCIVLSNPPKPAHHSYRSYSVEYHGGIVFFI